MKKIIVIALTILLSNSLIGNDTINPKLNCVVSDKRVMLQTLDNVYKTANFDDLLQYMKDDVLLIVETDSVSNSEIYGPKDRICASLTLFYRQIEYDMYEVYSRELPSCNYEYLVVCYLNKHDEVIPVYMLVKTDSVGIVYCLILS